MIVVARSQRKRVRLSMMTTLDGWSLAVCVYLYVGRARTHFIRRSGGTRIPWPKEYRAKKNVKIFNDIINGANRFSSRLCCRRLHCCSPSHSMTATLLLLLLFRSFRFPGLSSMALGARIQCIHMCIVHFVRDSVSRPICNAAKSWPRKRPFTHA